MNKFQKWLEDFGGAEALAKRLGVTERVVHHWRRGDGWPRISVILEIVELSRKRLSVEDVIQCTYPRSKRRNRA